MPSPTSLIGKFGSLRSKLSRKTSSSAKDNWPTNPFATSEPSQVSPYAQAPLFLSSGASAPTRRPQAKSSEPPPPYSASGESGLLIPSANPASISQSSFTSTPDDPFAFLSTFDTHFLIDDSGSMAGSSWRQTSKALAAITPICTSHDADGIDISFLNAPTTPKHRGIKRAETVHEIFSSVRPRGGTPTGTRLHAILRPYLRRYEAAPETTKPLNIIVITDGAASDDVESVLLSAAKKLDRLDAPAWQVGVQFFQVGNEPGAAEALAELDDELGGARGTEVRDMVDTVPWRTEAGSEGLSAAGVLKVVLGAVNRKLDRRARSGEIVRR
ncbi:MAG: hypothetical protein M1814_000409 [Vezdaea aestivalis]|nr:MAG: hypothetical protein M1814_000409 [Vezdaea aestivalis]